MKTFFVVLLIGGGFFYWQQHRNATPATATAEKTTAAPAAAATPRPVYEHDWAKHSLDRTHEVMDQVAKSREGNQQP